VAFALFLRRQRHGSGSQARAKALEHFEYENLVAFGLKFLRTLDYSESVAFGRHQYSPEYLHIGDIARHGNQYFNTRGRLI
jgi:hypothetical protein